MSHVDEGALHAYLDGALEEYPLAEAEWVREHLELCATCRDRLESERLIRDQAAAILGAAAPEVEAPSFEELRSYVRARAPRARPGSRRVHRLGWAASIVLALGAGWMLRGERPGAAVSTNEPMATRDPVEREASAEPQASAESAAGGAPSGERDARVAAADVDAVPEVPDVPDPVRLTDDGLLPSRTGLGGANGTVASAQTRETGAAPFSDEIAAPGSDAPPLPDAPRIEDSIAAVPLTPELLVDGAAPADDSGPTTREPRAAASRVVTSANASGPAAGIDAFGPALDVADVAETRRDDDDVEESYSLVVPGLEVLDVRFRGTGVRPEGQVALQRLESGDTLRVIHLPLELELSSLDPPEPTDRQVVVQTATGWIVMRAPVNEDAILDLMRRLLSAD